MKYVTLLLFLSGLHVMAMSFFPKLILVHLGIWLLLIGGLGVVGWHFGVGKILKGKTWSEVFPWHFWMMIGVAVVLRLALLEVVPVDAGGDEMTQALAAAEFASGENQDFFGLNGWYATPNFYYAVTSMAFRVLGVSVWAWRLTSVIFGVATVVLTYYWARLMGGWRLGLLAGLVLAGSHFHIHFSRLGAHQITDAFWAVVVGLTLFLGVERKRLLILVYSGLAAGIGLNFYFGARLIPVMAVLSLGLMSLNYGWRWLVRALLLFAAGFLIGWYPFAVTQLRVPEQFYSRVNQVMAEDSWSLSEVTKRGTIALRVLVLPGLTQWYTPSTGILSQYAFGWLVVGLLSVWGIGAIDRRRTGREYLRIWWQRSLPLLLWAFLPLFTVALFLDFPVASQRVVMILPVLAMIAGWGIWRVCSFILEKKWGLMAAIALVLVGVVIDGVLYFIRYTPERSYGGTNGMVANELGRLRTAPRGTRVVFFGPGRMWYHSFANVEFEMPHLEGINVEQDEVFDQLVEKAVYVALPERVAELEKLRTNGGRMSPVYAFWFERPDTTRERLAFYRDKARGVRMGEVYDLGEGIRLEKGELLFYMYDPEGLVELYDGEGFRFSRR